MGAVPIRDVLLKPRVEVGGAVGLIIVRFEVGVMTIVPVDK